MDQKIGSVESTEKILDSIKGMKDFDHIQRTKQSQDK